MQTVSAETTDTKTYLRAQRLRLAGFFVALLAASLLLRIFYSGNLYEDDGLWFTAAEEILRGKALYRDIYFDKPPLLALVYAALFKIFGAHIVVIRLFTVFYSVAIAAVLYMFGRRLYGRREGMIAAAAFVIFSTTYTSGHMQGLNTDFLMTLPYSAAACLFVIARMNAGAKSRLLALASGALAGLAFQTNPKAIFDLVFFAIFLLLSRKQIQNSAGRKAALSSDSAASPPHPHTPTPPHLFTLSLAGMIAAGLPFLVYLLATSSLSHYWTDVWVWGSRYAGYFPPNVALATALSQSAGYFALNPALAAALAVVVASVVRRMKQRRGKEEAAASYDGVLAGDVTLLAWLAVSYAGLATGGRFYGHYFFQIIPALCLIAARGSVIFIEWLKRSRSSSGRIASRACALALAVGFIFTVVRFHTRTFTLALDRARGSKSQFTQDWYQERLSREERMVVAFIKDLSEEEAAGLAPEALREVVPRKERAAGLQDYLFVWGYRPEIYYWSGLKPASGFLSTQPLTGVPADVHYFPGDQPRILTDEETSRARLELLGELERTRPKYIIDELGIFNRLLSIKKFPELQEFMEGYDDLGRVERFVVYRSKEFSRKKRNRKKRTETEPSVRPPIK